VNLVDEVWGENRPPHSTGTAMVLTQLYAGETWQSKAGRLGEKMNELGAYGTVVTALDEVAWLLNIRGSDIPYTPVVRSYVILKFLEDDTTLDLTLYVNSAKITQEIREHLKVGQLLQGVQAQIKNYEDVWGDLTSLGEISNKKILLSSRFSYNLGTSQAVHEKVNLLQIFWQVSL
jgi:Xaa-Pro aminopeptidase